MSENQQNKDVSALKRIEFKRPGYLLELFLTPSADRCTARYTAVQGGVPVSKSEIQSYLAQLKIVEGVCAEAVDQIANCALSGKGVNDILIASGTPMIPGDDARIELISISCEASGEKAESESDPFIVDMHHVQDFVNVNEGDRIGTILPPGKGTPGRSITGETIKAQEGKPLSISIGNNIRLDSDGVTLYAESSGRVCSREKEITVENIYQIAGDVGFKTGNIDFNGYLEIKGDVLDDFRVKAKGIKIGGNIGTCEIESEENLTFCGMNGQGGGLIRCGGEIIANFIYETDIESKGDIRLESEIRSCNVHTLGSIKISKGGVVGGVYIALGGVEANCIGNVNSIHTNIVAGSSYLDLNKLNRCFNELKSLIEKFNAGKGGMDSKDFQEKKQAITGRIMEIRNRKYPNTNAKVNAKKTIHSGTVITLSATSEEFRDDVQGPVSIIENKVDGGFRTLGMTDLSISAEEIEKSFIELNRKEEQ